MTRCLYCDGAGCVACDSVGSSFPDWYKGRSGYSAEYVLRGFHPTGMPLHVSSEAVCGSCRHFHKKADVPARCFFDATNVGIRRNRLPERVAARWRGCVFWHGAPVGPPNFFQGLSGSE